MQIEPWLKEHKNPTKEQKILWFLEFSEQMDSDLAEHDVTPSQYKHDLAKHDVTPSQYKPDLDKHDVTPSPYTQSITSIIHPE